MHGTAGEVERVSGTKGLHRVTFGLCSCERLAGPGRGCAEEPQEKLAASPPAQPALGVRLSKASITWRHIPVDGARTSQGRRTAQSYPSPFSKGQPRPPTDGSALKKD